MAGGDRRHPATAVTEWLRGSESRSRSSSVILAFHGQADTVQSTTFQTSVDCLVHMAGQILGNIFKPTNICNIQIIL